VDAGFPKRSCSIEKLERDIALQAILAAAPAIRNAAKRSPIMTEVQMKRAPCGALRLTQPGRQCAEAQTFFLVK
jgi:hypothetical protein